MKKPSPSTPQHCADKGEEHLFSSRVQHVVGMGDQYVCQKCGASTPSRPPESMIAKEIGQRDATSSDTPRTDAQHAKWRIADDPYTGMVEHARQLERELAATEACRMVELREAEKLSARSETAPMTKQGRQAPAVTGAEGATPTATPAATTPHAYKHRCAGCGTMWDADVEQCPSCADAKAILQKACDRDWKDETLYQTAVIASNAIYWRDQEIAKLKGVTPSAIVRGEK